MQLHTSHSKLLLVTQSGVTIELNCSTFSVIGTGWLHTKHICEVQAFHALQVQTLPEAQRTQGIASLT